MFGPVGLLPIRKTPSLGAEPQGLSVMRLIFQIATLEKKFLTFSSGTVLCSGVHSASSQSLDKCLLDISSVSCQVLSTDCEQDPPLLPRPPELGQQETRWHARAGCKLGQREDLSQLELTVSF